MSTVTTDPNITGIPSGGTGFDANGNGYSFPTVTLSNATGDEVAFQIDYTTNKATSGNDTGFVINQTDTLSPGTSLLQDWQVGGVTQYSFSNDVVGSQGVASFSFGGTIGFRRSATNGITVADGNDRVSFGGAGVNLRSTISYSWSSTPQSTGTADTGLKRDSAGVVKVTDGSVGDGDIIARNFISVSTVGITADVGSAQGGSPLTTGMNEISVCANVGDSVTLIAAVVDRSYEVTILNNGANACDVFPASGDNLGAGVDTAASLAAGADITYKSYDATNWFVKT